MKSNLIIACLCLVIYSLLSTYSCNRWKEQYYNYEQSFDTVYVTKTDSFISKPEIVYRDTTIYKWKKYTVYRDTGNIDTMEIIDSVYIPIFLNKYTESFSDSNVDINIRANVFGELDSLFVDYTLKYPVITKPEISKDGVFIGPSLLYNIPDKFSEIGVGITYLNKKTAISADYYIGNNIVISGKYRIR